MNVSSVAVSLTSEDILGMIKRIFESRKFIYRQN